MNFISKINCVLEERGRTHGDFNHHAEATQFLKDVCDAYCVNELSVVQKESLDMITRKIGRILSGDPNWKDHWVDIAGYSQLVVNDLEDSE